MKKSLAILLGKLILFLSRFLKLGGGFAAPGLYALKIEPRLVEKLASQLPINVVITGTNGKTTTARLLAHFAKHHGLKVIRNHTGSNLERGIASTLIKHARLGLWRLDYNLGIWEVDEAAFNTVAPKLNPNLVVFLNAFRDQLDRYGEVDSVVSKWCETVKKLSPTTTLIINGDDKNTSFLKACSKGQVISFGLEEFKIKGEGQSEIKPNILATNITPQGLKGSKFTVQGEDIHLPLAGTYQIYNFLAASIAAQNLGMPLKTISLSTPSFSAAFGRVEKIDLPTKKSAYLMLIKNPAGATAVFETVANEVKPQDLLFMALNDNLADGTDVSWIWDSEFEKLANYKGKIICSGIRAYDLVLRLKYAGFDPKKLIIEPNLEKAYKLATKQLKGRLFILPTYTAMLGVQYILTKHGLKGHYWKEEL